MLHALRRMSSLGIISLLAASFLSTGLATGPQPASAASYPSSYERLWSENCLAWERILTPNTKCVYGDKTSKTVIALVGDSHMSHLFPAIERIAIARHWKLVVMVKVSCGFHNLSIYNQHLGRTYTECTTWNKNVLKRLITIKPTLTLVLNSRYAIRKSISATAKGKAVGYMMAKVPGQVTIIVDSPRRGQTTNGALGAIEKIAATYSQDTVINLTKDTCAKWPCSSSSGGLTKFRDVEHLNARWARSVLGASGRILDKALVARLP